MFETERKVVDRFTSELKSDIIPYDTLPYLPCLTEDDREQIQYKQDREGPRAAVPLLLDRLKKREGGFEQLLTALESTGCKHLKRLLSESLPESPETTVTIPTKVYTSPPVELTPPTTPSQETDYSESLTSPSQEVDDSELQQGQETDDPEYDIFVCYSPKDRQMAYELRDVMAKEFKLSVCIDELDFIPGNAISNNICDCIRCSKAIVFLLTPDFLEKRWALWEMQHALLDFFNNQSTSQPKKIVPVMLKECKIPKELQPYTVLNFQELGSMSKMENWKRIAAAVQGQRVGSLSILEKFGRLLKLTKHTN